MTKQVDLVIYKGGDRHVVGRAAVNEDGSIEAQVAKDHWPVVKELLELKLPEMSLSPRPTIVRTR